MPAPPQELDRVAPVAAPEVDRQSRLVEPVERAEQRVVRRPIGDSVVERAPVGGLDVRYATTAAPPFSSSPNLARLTNCPMPGVATSSSFSTSTFPRSSTISGVPVTSMPS
jgi:hypothetical protein